MRRRCNARSTAALSSAVVRLLGAEAPRRSSLLVTWTPRSWSDAVLVNVFATKSQSGLGHIPPEPRGNHRNLRGDADAHRCCVKSLIGSALVASDVRQHARAESISEPAPSSA